MGTTAQAYSKSGSRDIPVKTTMLTAEQASDVSATPRSMDIPPHVIRDCFPTYDMSDTQLTVRKNIETTEARCKDHFPYILDMPSRHRESFCRGVEKALEPYENLASRRQRLPSNSTTKELSAFRIKRLEEGRQIFGKTICPGLLRKNKASPKEDMEATLATMKAFNATYIPTATFLTMRSISRPTRPLAHVSFSHDTLAGNSHGSQPLTQALETTTTRGLEESQVVGTVGLGLLSIGLLGTGLVAAAMGLKTAFRHLKKKPRNTANHDDVVTEQSNLCHSNLREEEETTYQPPHVHV